MPYYMARGVSTRLGAMPLAGTTSSEIITNYKTDKFEKLLQTSKLLDETPVPFPGDEGQHRLNWLGDTPFIQVQAFLDGSGEKRLNTKKAPIGSTTAQEIKALVLHVNFSDRTYVSGLSGKKTSFKIEILFNGQLCDCRLISLHDTRSHIKGAHQIFAGTRVDSYAERPWVVLSSGMAPDGSFETNYKSVSVPQRWQDICQALQSEASQRGANKDGEVPPTAMFLEALASMQMPDQVNNMQKPGGRVFGTIDVVITAGKGRKIQAGQPLVKEPKRMPDKHYSLMQQSADSAAYLQLPRSKQNSSNVVRQSPEPDADGDSHRDHEFHSEQHASGFSTEHQTNTPSSLGLAQPSSDHQVPNDARYPYVNSEHQYPVNPSGPYQDDFQNPQMLQLHSSLWSPLSDTTREPNTLSPNGDLAVANATPYTRSLDSFHADGHGPSCPPLVTHVGDIGMELQQSGSDMLPMPYWSPQEPAQGFDHVQFSFGSENPLEVSGPSSIGAQGYAPILHSVQMAPSLVNHDLPRWSPMPGPSSDDRLTGPLPPVGLYSVPAKPKRSAISQTKPVPIQSKKSTSVISLRKLVILGQNKVILVECQWDPPKRLEVGLTMPISAEGQPNLPKSMNTSPELIRHKDTPAAIREPATTVGRRSVNSNEESAQSYSGHAREALPSNVPILSTGEPEHLVHNEPSSKPSTRKKGKTDRHTAVNEPRSFLGLKAPHNPPLNQGCVIAYAESQDKEDEQGIVRQVRAERAGHFEEYYVIFATRFFVGEGWLL